MVVWFLAQLNILGSCCPKLKGFAPNIIEADSRIKSVQNTKRQREVDYDGPEPILVLVDVGLTGVDDVDHPEREVDHQQEAHHLPAWLPSLLSRGADRPLDCVSDEEGLEEGLEDDEELGAKTDERLQPLNSLNYSEEEREDRSHRVVREEGGGDGVEESS